METTDISCNLIHHGAAATSSSKVVIAIPSGLDDQSSEIVYASHALLNISRSTKIKIGDSNEEPIWNVYQTLRTSTRGSSSNSANVATMTAKRVITCVAQLTRIEKGQADDNVILACGFSDGTITSWNRINNNGDWNERVLVTNDNNVGGEYGRSITDIGGMVMEDDTLVVISCSSGGAMYHKFQKGNDDDEPIIIEQSLLVKTPANSLRFHTLQSGKTLVLIGTAAPRHNKIHVFLITSQIPPTYCGALTGHEDWITCFDWFKSSSLSSAVDFLASGSQDAKIRLWKFETTTITNPTDVVKTAEEFSRKVEDDDDANDDDDDEGEDDGALEDKKEEGEARLEIYHESLVTSVFLEALLIGHEERVTSVTWHPNPKPVYNQDLILISSSMDRTILIWSEHETGIWTPISRVGSAGGILGGSIGSSLLGFLNTTIEPINGDWLLGHGYGGALHFFSCEQNHEEIANNTDMTIEERAALSPWRALPCVTGHFDGVTDLCWETASGDYLVTVSHDHTCRVWASTSTDKRDAWIEIARPQVHGYNLSAITSLSTAEYPHLLVSGGDEKELRAFDATNAFIRLLKMTSITSKANPQDAVERVERAYIPSLGLSNKATAADGAEEDTGGASESSTKLPLERDLGAVSLWPEVRKLYGHSSELARLTSTVQAQTNGVCEDSSLTELLVASSAKARDVETACIRIWDVKDNRCVQVLAGGHRSTVTALSFSPNGKYLASSGKDRRLCLWERQAPSEDVTNTPVSFSLIAAVDSAHKRIVWGVHFCPFDSSMLASGSRDGSVKIWNLEKANQEQPTTMSQVFHFSPMTKASNGKAESVTALSFAPTRINGNALLALGLDNGIIELWTIPLNGTVDQTPELVKCFEPMLCHISTVTKLAWRPKPSDGRMVLASCSSDHGCRIFEITKN